MDDLRVSFIPSAGEPVAGREIELLGKIELPALLSVRTPGAHRKQGHIPGYFWMAQIDDHIWYESRLEMMILKTIDHERDIRGAISQPFLLSFRYEGKKRTHVPDFLFPLKEGRALLVNVKLARYLNHQKNRINFAACQVVADRLGWEYVTRTEPPPEYAANIKWLNGYRRSPWLLEKFRAELLRRTAGSATIGEVLRDLEPAAFARPVLFYLMWSRQICFDSSVVLSDSTKLWTRDAR